MKTRVNITQQTMAARLRPRAIRPLVRAESWSPFRSSSRAYRIIIISLSKNLSNRHPHGPIYSGNTHCGHTPEIRTPLLQGHFMCSQSDIICMHDIPDIRTPF